MSFFFVSCSGFPAFTIDSQQLQPLTFALTRKFHGDRPPPAEKVFKAYFIAIQYRTRKRFAVTQAFQSSPSNLG
jgi:hypothetical protein